jgi:hypothetical protein
MVQNPPSSRLDAFVRHAKRIKEIVKLGGEWLAVLLPFVAVFSPIAPPWPSPFLAVCFAIAVDVVIGCLTYISWKNGIALITRKKLFASVCVSVIFAATYLTLFSYFVVHLPGAPVENIVAGFTRHPDIEAIVQERPSYFTNAELLDNAEHQPDRIWTIGSLTSVRVLLLVVWVGLWTSVACVSAFVVTQLFPPTPIFNEPA